MNRLVLVIVILFIPEAVMEFEVDTLPELPVLTLQVVKTLELLSESCLQHVIYS